MKHLWIGIGILSLLLTLGIVSNVAASLTLRESETLLQQADEALDAGDLPAALEKSRQAEARWRSAQKMLHIMMSHTLIDEVDTSFSNLRTYGEEDETTEYRASCRELILQLRHLRDMDIPHYYHFL